MHCFDTRQTHIVFTFCILIENIPIPVSVSVLILIKILDWALLQFLNAFLHSCNSNVILISLAVEEAQSTLISQLLRPDLRRQV